MLLSWSTSFAAHTHTGEGVIPNKISVKESECKSVKLKRKA